MQMNDTAPGSATRTLDENSVHWMHCVANNQDRHAFERLYEHYAPRIKVYMVRQGADNATADDLAQETLVQVWRKAKQYDPARAVPSAWIYRVARNLRIDRLRRQKFHEVELTEEMDRVDVGNTEATGAAEQIDSQRLHGFVETLPVEQMEVVKLAYFEGLTHSEVGKRLSIPQGTVKSRLRLAVAKLRMAMGEQT